ncbi:MAG: precorrin-3B C(17)-methyltransferase [Alphaproteobacteria bacterium]|nr:precorrin-3B C(17)-methyltransferase [Alphaproteobacteria bacterium]
MASFGILYGIGVGPGDPELLTLKARRLIAAAVVVAYPAPEGGSSFARAIAAPHIPPGKIEVALEVPMVPGLSPHHPSYDRHAETLAAHLAAGRDVALLCEGDPLLFGSFIQMLERLAPRFTVEVVPGVSSILAGAAAAGLPLAVRAESFAVVPATLAEDEIARRARAADSVAVLKAGRHLAKIKSALARAGFTNPTLVERATLPDGRVVALKDAPASAPYFSLVLARRDRPAASKIHVPENVAFVALTAEGLALARTARAALPGAEIHGLKGRADGADETFADTAAHLRGLFRAGRPIVGVCAAGILARALASELSDKREEPPVVALSADGRFAVPVLGGHRGANRLAALLAQVLGGQAAVTTAGEAALGVALDDPPPGWRLGENKDKTAKDIAARLLAGEEVALIDEAGDARWLSRSGAKFSATGAFEILATTRAQAGDEETFVLHPPALAVGAGCERNAEPAELIALAEETLAQAGLTPKSVACVVSAEVKADEPAIHALAAHWGVPARFFAPAELEHETPRLANPSDAVFRAVGSHGVAEAAALAAAGPAGALIVTKSKSARATVAVARAAAGADLDGFAIGRARGRLFIVGIGPGAAEWRTPAATRALAESTDVVGYSLYLDLVGDVIEGKRRHDSNLAEEEARVRLALDLAAQGRTVALVCSGDAGIYALATLAFELLDSGGGPGWNKIEVSTVPGISAMQAAAARIGAPLGHDFCAISLSDLLTPWADIERRLRAAAEGDFVVALYNPVSKRRREQIVRARDILLARRSPATPVVLARNLGRADERYEVVNLADLAPERVDMLTLVLVGSSNTRAFARDGETRVYTPRGYLDKREQAS